MQLDNESLSDNLVVISAVVRLFNWQSAIDGVVTIVVRRMRAKNLTRIH